MMEIKLYIDKHFQRKLETSRQSTTSWVSAVHNFVDDCIYLVKEFMIVSKGYFFFSYWHSSCKYDLWSYHHCVLSQVSLASVPPSPGTVGTGQWVGGGENVRMWGWGKPPKQKFKLVIVSRNWMGIVCRCYESPARRCSLLAHLTHLSSEMKKMR